MNGTAADNTFDVVVVGAGISGINAAYRVQSQLPGYSYAVLEARDSVGGTWDLFRYPGIRSDSDLFTFGFPWNPWNQPEAIAAGGAIVQYIKDSAAKYGIDKHILFQHRLTLASWSTEEQAWTLSVQSNGETLQYTTRFLIWGTGYYNYDTPLPAIIPGLKSFEGQVVHPQFWPEDLDYTGKNIVIIGSGATAVTLLPNLAGKAAKVTMLQRSPSYILSLPNPTRRSWYSWFMPESLYLRIKRLSWMLSARLLFLFCQTFPTISKLVLRCLTTLQLPKDIPFDPHFKPSYNPWDQRLCLCPGGDFFKSLRSGKADVKTDTISRVVSDGIMLNSGEKLPADIIVTATGLKVEIAGQARVEVDGKKVRIADHFVWKGMMVQDIPNTAFIIGYTNASWTLGADATSRFICRLLKYLERNKFTSAVPRLDSSNPVKPVRLLNLKSTYVERAEKDLPKAGDSGPWRPRDNYIVDSLFADYGDITDGMEFTKGTGLRLHPKSL
ncbi:hypothetical protein MPDQ_007226 [Monascus purpureus]|uniref:FAD/NAD(P)-binding domain-containing protein n=1 Tax=Monascus purpureus TaxID=5098 RepID=A0A507QSU2_MONPU|nr:hypothetical protein MPDQ_007226 [Monascus purpureus]BDD57646.1 hypothetical protein MAP00_002993 [Monascus purpureus]